MTTSPILIVTSGTHLLSTSYVDNKCVPLVVLPH